MLWFQAHDYEYFDFWIMDPSESQMKLKAILQRVNLRSSWPRTPLQGLSWEKKEGRKDKWLLFEYGLSSLEQTAIPFLPRL